MTGHQARLYQHHNVPFAARHEHQKDVLPVAEQYMQNSRISCIDIKHTCWDLLTSWWNFRKFADAKSLDALTGCSSWSQTFCVFLWQAFKRAKGACSLIFSQFRARDYLPKVVLFLIQVLGGILLRLFIKRREQCDFTAIALSTAEIRGSTVALSEKPVKGCTKLKLNLHPGLGWKLRRNIWQ